MEEKDHCSFFGSRSSSSHHWKSREGNMSQTSVSQTSCRKHIISQTVDGEARESRGSPNSSRSGFKGGGGRNHMHGCRSLLSNKASSGSIVESSFESSLGSSDFLCIIKIGRGNLRGLHIG